MLTLECGMLASCFYNLSNVSIACLMCLLPGPRAHGPGPGPKIHRFYKTTYCARVLIEGARFPPFGFDTAETSSNSNEIMLLSNSGIRLELHWGHFGTTFGI